MAVTFHQGVSTAPPHQQLGIVFVWFRAISLLSAFSTICFYHHIASKRYALFHQHTYTFGVLCFTQGHKVKLDFRLHFELLSCFVRDQVFSFCQCLILFLTLHFVFFYIICCTSSPNSSCVRVQACRDRVRALQTKMAARNERIKLIHQRGVPDSEPLDT